MSEALLREHMEIPSPAGEPGQALFLRLHEDNETDLSNGQREVYDARGTEDLPGTKLRFEGEPSTGIDEADRVYEYSGEVRQFFKDVFGRNSIDDKGMKIVSTINYGDGFDNALWDGEQMIYGKPSKEGPFKTFVLLDMTGHEMMHGITDRISGMEYWGQSGALQEHISDVFGELIQQRARGTSAKDADWIIADGTWKPEIHGQGIRSMLEPGTAYDDPIIGKDQQVAHFKHYFRTTMDSGGVHYNSGIPNRAFALFSIDVGGNAWDKPAKIWYEALHHVGTKPSFAQFAYQTVAAAKRLGYFDEIPKLEKAWSLVGISPSATELDTRTPPRPQTLSIKDDDGKQ